MLVHGDKTGGLLGSHIRYRLLSNFNVAIYVKSRWFTTAVGWLHQTSSSTQKLIGAKLSSFSLTFPDRNHYLPSTIINSSLIIVQQFTTINYKFAIMKSPSTDHQHPLADHSSPSSPSTTMGCEASKDFMALGEAQLDRCAAGVSARCASSQPLGWGVGVTGRLGGELSDSEQLR